MLPTSAALRTALLRIYALAAGLTVLAGGLLFAVGFNFSPNQAWVGLGVIAPLAFVPMLLVDVWALLRQFASGRYVAPELAEQVMKHGVQLGGQTVTATVLFADIRGFTTIAEALTPEAVVTLLNEYFAAVEPAIQAHGGWINKFGGDSLLAVFGTPVNYPDHARRAVQAALGMRAALAAFNRRREASGQPPLAVGMGLHTGPLVAGNVGSPTRMEYTVIGDIVNAASRIDGLNKDWHTDILLSADTFRAAGGDFPARAMPPVALKGKTQTIAVFALD